GPRPRAAGEKTGRDHPGARRTGAEGRCDARAAVAAVTDSKSPGTLQARPPVHGPRTGGRLHVRTRPHEPGDAVTTRPRGGCGQPRAAHTLVPCPVCPGP